MLHILWLILKFILILAGVLLGTVLLLLLLLLFCPVCYRAEAEKKEGGFEDAKIKGWVSWLFHLLAVRVSFQNKKLQYELYVFGIPVLNVLKRIKNRKKQKASFEAETENQPERKLTTEAPSKPEIKTEAPSKPEIKTEDPPKPKLKAEDQTTQRDENTRWMHKIQEILEKLKALAEKVTRAIQDLEETRNKIRDQITWWKKFTGHPRFKRAWKLLKGEGRRVIRHILPNSVSGEVTFGSEDPAMTGKILAILGMATPLHRNRIKIHPLLDGSSTAFGQIRVRGRIYGIVPVYAFLRLYFSKDIKFVMHHWKKKED